MVLALAAASDAKSHAISSPRGTIPPSTHVRIPIHLQASMPPATSTKTKSPVISRSRVTSKAASIARSQTVHTQGMQTNQVKNGTSQTDLDVPPSIKSKSSKRQEPLIRGAGNEDQILGPGIMSSPEQESAKEAKLNRDGVRTPDVDLDPSAIETLCISARKNTVDN